MNAIGYVRRSAKTDDKVVSIDTQRDHIARYCSAKGWTLAAVIEHDGISGTRRIIGRARTRRGRYDDLEKAITAHAPGALCYYYQDRIARDVGLIDYLKTVAKRGIEIHETAGAGKVDMATAIGRMSINIRATVDAAFAEMTGERTRDALARIKGEGRRYTNLPPLGYYYDDGRMIEEPEEQRALELIKHAAAQGMGARKALAILQAANYTGRQSLKAIHCAMRRT